MSALQKFLMYFDLPCIFIQGVNMMQEKNMRDAGNLDMQFYMHLLCLKRNCPANKRKRSLIKC